MAEHRPDEQFTLRDPTEGLKSILPEKCGPSKLQVMVAITVLPAGAFLLLLAGLTLTGTLIGLALSTPLFFIFSPILVPAALTLAVAVFGFLTSGAFGITALSALSWTLNYLRSFGLEQARRRVQDRAAQMGQKGQEASRT